MKKDDVVYSLGKTDPQVIYQLALFLSMVQDTLCIDMHSEFAFVFQGLVNSAFLSLPDQITLFFGEDE